VHPGNTQWRMLVAANKELYITLPKKQKMLLSQSIVNAVRSQMPSGRFLQKDMHNDLWYDVGDKRAQEKTSQALREGAPEIRTKLSTNMSAHATETVVSVLATVSSTTTQNRNDLTNNVSIEPPPYPELPTSNTPIIETKVNIIKKEKPDSTGSSSNDVSRIRTVTHDTISPQISNDFVVQAAMNDIPPQPQLGHATSKEQMPPPVLPAMMNQPEVYHAEAQPRQNQVQHPVTAMSTTAPLPYSQQHHHSVEYYNPNQYEYTIASSAPQIHHHPDTTLFRDEYYSNDPMPVVPPPPPQPLTEAHAGCSFGSMGLMSDEEQAQLMNSFSARHPSSSHGDHPPLHDRYVTDHHHHYPDANYGVGTTSSASQNVNPFPTSTRYPAATTNSYYHSNGHYDYQQQQQQPYSHPLDQQDNYGAPMSSYGNRDRTEHRGHCDQLPQPVDGGLEPTGFSFGSMMSIGTAAQASVVPTVGDGTKLEDAGLSIGSMMSSTPIKNNMRRGSGSAWVGRNATVLPPDGGLQDVGMSFGSLSLAEGDRERIIAEAERDLASEVFDMGSATATVDDAFPTLLHQQKSTNNLLECSDSEAEDEDTTTAASAQKSAEQWNILQATLAEQDESLRNNIMPPMLVLNSSRQQQHEGRGGPDTTTTARIEQQQSVSGRMFDVPTLDRDFSQMSAISVGEDFEPQERTSHSYRYSDIYPMQPGTVEQHYRDDMQRTNSPILQPPFFKR
jgi:hypothetical protein